MALSQCYEPSPTLIDSFRTGTRASYGGWPMARRQIPEYLTFDDVLMKPGASSVLPGEVSTRTHITRDIQLSIPIISAAMDTVTEASLAIAMAQRGGLGVIQKNIKRGK